MSNKLYALVFLGFLGVVVGSQLQAGDEQTAPPALSQPVVVHSAEPDCARLLLQARFGVMEPGFSAEDCSEDDLATLALLVATKSTGGCVGYPVPPDGCWQCGRQGSKHCGPTVASGATPFDRYGAPSRCEGQSAYPVGRCCETAYQSGLALSVGWCVANRTAGAVNPLGLAWAGCDGTPAAVEALDHRYSRAWTDISEPGYGLAEGLRFVASVSGRSVTVSVTRPPYAVEPASIDWGDGSPPGSATTAARHSYAPGRYRLRASAADACGWVREANVDVVIEGEDPPEPPDAVYELDLKCCEDGFPCISQPWPPGAKDGPRVTFRPGVSSTSFPTSRVYLLTPSGRQRIIDCPQDE
ncbi:MAG TPA: PKD domain-containing protein [Thermoanaerobaculia bacterium]|nr:PKD domain-containing protein [Thermoanaerobaculia bacterium]